MSALRQVEDGALRATVFDTETTGLILNRTVRKAMWPEVIEFSSITFDWVTDEEINDYTTLIKPAAMITDDTTKRTGIDNAMVKDSPPFAEVRELIKNILEVSNLVIAHNASFDVEMIDLEFEKLGEKIKWPRAICTVELTAGFKGRRLTLGELHEMLFGLKHEGAHRADADVRALLNVVLRLKGDGYL
jgi:DNA polymerase-3 subunit epsilon